MLACMTLAGVLCFSVWTNEEEEEECSQRKEEEEGECGRGKCRKGTRERVNRCMVRARRKAEENEDEEYR